jgi:mannitol-1-phosphate 5-dehydrogenase
MSVFLGVGLGPIQTGIFLLGASKGGMDRLVIAEVDPKLKNAISSGGGKVTVNIAADDKIYQESMSGVEILSPADPADLKKLAEAAADADEIATALPSVNFFQKIAPWLREGFEKKPDKQRFIYTAENHNHAAELLQEALGKKFPATWCLNTVIGKMSGVVPASECDAQKLAKLSPAAERGHLVEEFNKILISDAPGVESRKVTGLHVKKDLLPFEEAKLYGHNAVHFLLGLLGAGRGRKFMSELRADKELMKIGGEAFINESGAALCKKYRGFDELFTPAGFKAYANELLVRMTNPFLKDAIDRVTRDLERKLSWQDRSVGAMRVVLGQGIQPEKLAKGAALAAKTLFGGQASASRAGLVKLWGSSADVQEREKILALITKNL